MTEQIDRDRLRKLTEDATPGPWEMDKDWAAMSSGPDSVFHAYTKHPECEVCGEGVDGEAEVAIGYEDAEFIAAARQAIPELLDALDRAEARLGAVRDVLDRAEQRHENAVLFNGASFPAIASVPDVRRALDGDT